MNDYIAKRAVAAGEYLVLAKATVRQTAKKFGVSKSTVHKDVSERLVEIDPALAAKVRKILEKNKCERHIRGGIATREKYKRERSLKDKSAASREFGFPGYIKRKTQQKSMRASFLLCFSFYVLG